MPQRVVPSEDFKEKPRLTDLEIRILETPALVIDQSAKEIERMANGCFKMIGWLEEPLQQDERDIETGNQANIKELRRQHLEILSNGNTPPLVSIAFLASLNAYYRDQNHAHDIAEVVSSGG